MRYDACIAGAGAAGLAAACALAREGAQVALLERRDRAGKKLLGTGNGRCNLTNLSVQPERYFGDRRAAWALIERCGPDAARAFFDALGVPTITESDGRAYPRSRQAASVVNALRLYLDECGVRTVTGCAAVSVAPIAGGLRVVTDGPECFDAKTVLVATGGLSAPKVSGTTDAYRLLDALGHTRAPLRPALSPLRTAPERVRALKGQRLMCAVTLFKNGKPLRREEGEVLFGDAALSGIACMQLARLAGDALAAGARCEAQIALFEPGTALPCVESRARALPRRPVEAFLDGIVSHRIGAQMTKEAGLPATKPAGALTCEELAALALRLEDWRFPVLGVSGFDAAQVTAGGFYMKEFDPDTLESFRLPGLYAAGEVLNVDADCGGFNLQWAWTSALTAARSMLRRIRSKP